MSEQKPPADNDNGSGGENIPGDASEQGEASTTLTLEQALLAPLDSILKAQLHSARSFLNLLLQLGYPHKGDDDKEDGHPYCLDFQFTKDGETQKLSVPALSLVPISPLAVDSANFQLEMSAKRIIKQTQIRESEKDKVDTVDKKKFDRYQRPWFLIDKPRSIEGEIVASSNTEASRQSQSAIKININVKSIPIPAGLDKLLSTMSNMAQISPVEPNPDDKNIEQNKELPKDK